jgi:hypothetical protein
MVLSWTYTRLPIELLVDIQQQDGIVKNRFLTSNGFRSLLCDRLLQLASMSIKIKPTTLYHNTQEMMTSV